MRVFIDQNGKTYKAETPRDLSDIERLNVSDAQIDALPEDGSTLDIADYAKAIRLMDTNIQEIIDEIA